ncbi:MAG: hypothetical protein GF334_05765 [Candidatus Altiarchaeales archaeon]|nr:hypothetical protein [Candidatus Altiarchaeales archaeon]
MKEEFHEVIEWALTRRTVRVRARDYPHAMEKIEEGHGLIEGVYHQKILIRHPQGEETEGLPEEVGRLAESAADSIKRTL